MADPNDPYNPFVNFRPYLRYACAMEKKPMLNFALFEVIFESVETEDTLYTQKVWAKDEQQAVEMAYKAVRKKMTNWRDELKVKEVRKLEKRESVEG